MKKIKSIVFFGTHELAPTALETLLELDLRPDLVVSGPLSGVPPLEFPGLPEPPKPHAVREWAEAHETPLEISRYGFEPELQERIEKIAPDLILSVDFGAELPTELVAIPSCGAFGVHGSHLPKLRGEHPLRGALALGERKAGVSVYEIDEEPWGGPVILQEELDIEDKETFGELLPRAQKLTVELLAQALEKIDRSKKKPGGKKQNEKSASHAPTADQRHRKMPWSLKPEKVFDRLRAYTPGGLYTYCKRRPVEIVSGLPMEWVETPFGSTGTYLGMRQGKLAVLCGESSAFGVSRLRRPGGETQTASAFAIAEGLRVGDSFI